MEVYTGMTLTSPPDVFTLEEAAAYLKLPPEMILRQAAQGNLPGRKIEDTWRFLKAAIDDWLRLQNSRTLLLQQVGALSEDESLAALRTDIYQTRGRPEISPDISPRANA